MAPSCVLLIEHTGTPVTLYKEHKMRVSKIKPFNLNNQAYLVSTGHFVTGPAEPTRAQFRQSCVRKISLQIEV